MEVRIIQLEIDDNESKKHRIARIEELLDSLQGADLIMLPEIWSIGYFSFDRYKAEAEKIGGETTHRMAKKAQELDSYLLAGSIVEEKGSSFYNTSLLFNPAGELIATYRKIHLFGYGSKEAEILSAGQEIIVTETDLGNVGLSTCYDLRFPELYRRQIDKGAEIFLITSAWPYPRIEHWLLLNRVRALENLSFLISANCVGENGGSSFLGRSSIIDPWGNTIAAGGDKEVIVSGKIDLNEVRQRRNSFPSLKDRVL